MQHLTGNDYTRPNPNPLEVSTIYRLPNFRTGPNCKLRHKPIKKLNYAIALAQTLGNVHKRHTAELARVPIFLERHFTGTGILEKHPRTICYIVL